MASAQTEPSMDEILASIRRIISEEDEAPEVPVRQKLETLQLREEAAVEEASADDADAAADAAEPEAKAQAKTAPAEEATDAVDAEAATAEAAAEVEADAATETAGASEAAADDLDAFEPLPEEPVAAASTMEPAAAEHDAGAVTDTTFDDETPSMNEQVAAAVRPAVMAAAQADFGVSDETASQAANAFGALEENMRLSTGSGRTIEDLIEAMLTPMLQNWLDENLSRIVEDKVEEEVRRISRRR